MNYNQFENYSLENGWTLDKVENSKNYEGVVYTKGSGSKKEFITLNTDNTILPAKYVFNNNG